MAGRKWRGRASGKQCQEYIPQVSAWVPALTICSALGLATLPLAVTNPGWTVSPLAQLLFIARANHRVRLFPRQLLGE
ncbi:hypothetical protein nublan010_11910 [Klebsiella pneumoniae]